MRWRTQLSFVREPDRGEEVVVVRWSWGQRSQVVAYRCGGGYHDPDHLQARSRQLIDFSRLMLGGAGRLEITEA